MKVTYNSIDYVFNENETLLDLLNREDLIVLPLLVWKTILLLKSGFVSAYSLYKILVAKINHYDKSFEVNAFHYKGMKYWLDKNTRLSLVNLVNSSDDTIQLFLDSLFLEISSKKLKEFLKQLEVYASKCYVNTQKHLLKIKELRTVEDLINYDYTTGYPEKITLNE